jgi:glutamate 5-kinase
MGKRSDAVLELLGAGNRAALVHRDNMVLVGAKEETADELG